MPCENRLGSLRHYPLYSAKDQPSEKIVANRR
jgi:hypothetical protein